MTINTNSNAQGWTIACQCNETVLKAHGAPIQIAICHCSDCRMAQGGNAATQNLALMRRDQVESSLDNLKVVAAEEYIDKVPRYYCDACGDCLVGDCTPVGFDMVIVPTSRMSDMAELGDPDYHMHLEHGTTEPPADGLPRFQGNPEDPYMAALVEGCA